MITLKPVRHDMSLREFITSTHGKKIFHNTMKLQIETFTTPRAKNQ